MNLKFLVIFLLAFINISLAATATYIDSLNRSSIGSNWTTITDINALQMRGDTCAWRTTTSARNGMYYNAAPESDSQVVSCIIYGGIYKFVACAVQYDEQSGYVFGYNDAQTDIVIAKYIAGSFSVISSKEQSISYGSKFTIVHWSDTLVGLIDDVPFDTGTDSDLGAGRGGFVGYSNSEDSGTYDNFVLMQKEDASDCDSVVNVGFTDSTAKQLIAKGYVPCDTADTILTVWSSLSDPTGYDTITHTGNALGDTLRDTISAIPSTGYRIKYVDSVFSTVWDTSYTMDSSAGIPIYFCTYIGIDSILGPDSVQVGDTIKNSGKRI